MDLMDTSGDLADNGPLVNFLENNTKRLGAEIDKIQKTIECFVKQSEDVIKEIADEEAGVQIRYIGKKMFYDKYALWYQIKNNTEKLMENFNFCLQWTACDTFSYMSTMHTAQTPETGINTPFYNLDLLEEEALLVVVFDRPLYMSVLTIAINGVLSYSDEHEIIYVDELPEVVIGTQDLYDGAVNITLIEQNGNLHEFYTRLVCSFKVDLIIELVEGTDISLALIASGLMPLGLHENIPQRFYTAFMKSPTFDGAILEVGDVKDSTYDVTVYTKNENTLLNFIHFLYQKINPVIILPSEYKLRVPSSTIIEPISDLQTCMVKEMSFLRDIEDKDFIPLPEYKKLKADLVDLEYETDLAYLSVLTTEDKNENS